MLSVNGDSVALSIKPEDMPIQIEKAKVSEDLIENILLCPSLHDMKI